MTPRKTNLIYDYSKKIISAAQAADKIEPGNKIFLSSGVAAPRKILTEILKSEKPNIQDLEFIQLVALGDEFSAGKNSDRYRLKAFVLGESISREIAEGKVDFIPANLVELPYIFMEGAVHVDVVIIQTSIPNEKGFVSLGVAVDVADIVIKQASLVIAEINPNMPVTMGETTIHLSSIDFVVETDMQLIEREVKPYDEIMARIGWNVSNIIENGSTVVLHLGRIFRAIADNLKNKKDLGILTHVISDWVIDLIESGAISIEGNRFSGGLVTTSYCFGTRALYDYINKNPVFAFFPISMLGSPARMEGITRLVSILNVKRIDISGESVVFFSGDNLLSGHESKLHFATAATYSRTGKSIVVLNSVDQEGNSNIVIKHDDMHSDKPHSTLGLMRYIVTEYGVANIFGKTIRERVLSMIEIAHPDHREKLLAEAKSLNYVHPDQIYDVKNAINYPSILETRKTLPEGLEIKVRPVKISDVDMMRNLFYNFSDEAIYYRYFVPKPVMPHNEMQDYINIDYNEIMSIVAVLTLDKVDKIIAEARYAYDEDRNTYELAFIVDEEYQGKGVGTFLLELLIKTARERGIKKLSASVLVSNKAMLRVFSKLNLKYRETFESNFVTLDFELSE